MSAGNRLRLSGRRLDNILAGTWLFGFVFIVAFLVILGS